MTKHIMNPAVDFYFDKAGKWQAAIQLLRPIALGCGLTEELKWGCPCYTNGKSNIVLIHVFKEYCALLFFKGALLKDPKNILVQPTANVQAARQIRFTDAKMITKMAPILSSYIKAAITIEEAGLKVPLKKPAEFAMADEFKQALDKNKTLHKAFYALTPGRQRGYLLYFAAAKQAQTRQARVEKYTPLILAGKGLNDA